MAEATVDFGLGLETVTSVLEIDLGVSETILTGDIDAVVLAGTTARLRGNCRLLNNLHVRGTLICDPTDVVLDGQNLWDIHTHDGGVLNLRGVQKSAWVRWGETPIGWQVGDRLAFAPTKTGIYINPAASTPNYPVELTWTGSWATMTRPVNSPTVTLLDGRTIEPEVINLAQTVTLKNLARIMMHEANGVPNVHNLRWLRVLDSGRTGQLGFYSIHFHQLGESARGSLVEGVVVEGSKNHSFVPHASHGITMRDCVAYRVMPGAFWWDPPVPGPNENSAINNSNDTTWERCGVLWVSGTGTGEAFSLGAGHGNKILDSFAVGVIGAKNASGFHWPGNASQNLGGNVWESARNVSHNHRNQGVFIWQNGGSPFSPLHHENDDWIIYRCGRNGWEHGAYSNNYEQRRMVIQECGEHAIGLHAIGAISHIDLISDDSVLVGAHSLPNPTWVAFTRAVFTKLIYQTNEWEEEPSFIRLTDCHTPGGSPFGPSDCVNRVTLEPIAITPGGIHPNSEIEIVEGGVLAHRWAAGVWS